MTDLDKAPHTAQMIWPAALGCALPMGLGATAFLLMMLTGMIDMRAGLFTPGFA